MAKFLFKDEVAPARVGVLPGSDDVMRGEIVLSANDDTGTRQIFTISERLENSPDPQPHVCQYF